VLLAGVQGITDLITTPGLINLDFADVKSVMSGAGSALMGIGASRGADRAIKAAELAVASPLLEASIDGAHGVLLSIQGGSNLGIFEINDAARLVQEAVHPEANIIFGAVIDDTLGDEVRVTVIAAGFHDGAPQQLRRRRGAGQRGRRSLRIRGRRLGRLGRRARLPTAAAAGQGLRRRRRSGRPRLPQVVSAEHGQADGTGDGLAERLARVDAAIADAARAAGRDPSGLTRIVVTKFHPAQLVAELAGLGVRDVGENRHQEAAAKAAELEGLDLNWHFVGQLQSNKAKAVRRYAHAVHSLDRASLADALAGATPLDVFLEVNLTGDPARGGADPALLEPLGERVLSTPGLVLRGVMAVAPLGEQPRAAFERVREASMALQRLAPDATAISAGMSGDFREAILEGATHLRIGTAITGKRPTPG
jgi:pyridoxal phosphate enzyme (YggS family)